MSVVHVSSSTRLARAQEATSPALRLPSRISRSLPSLLPPTSESRRSGLHPKWTPLMGWVDAALNHDDDDDNNNNSDDAHTPRDRSDGDESLEGEPPLAESALPPQHAAACDYDLLDMASHRAAGPDERQDDAGPSELATSTTLVWEGQA